MLLCNCRAEGEAWLRGFVESAIEGRDWGSERAEDWHNGLVGGKVYKYGVAANA